MMADASNIIVAVETALHDAMWEVAINARKKHGVRICHVSFNWLDITLLDGTRSGVLQRVSMSTDTDRGRDD
jgi:hypothetical protein